MRPNNAVLSLGKRVEQRCSAQLEPDLLYSLLVVILLKYCKAMYLNYTTAIVRTELQPVVANYLCIFSHKFCS